MNDLRVDHVELYVGDAAATAANLVGRYGFDVVGVSGAPGRPGPRRDHYSIALRQGDITLVATEAVGDQHPAGLYVQRHGDGVGNIALGTADARAAYGTAVDRGAEPLAAPAATSDGVVTATVGGFFGDVTHTFIQRPAGTRLPGFIGAAKPGDPALPRPELRVVDHLAVCLEAGSLGPTVERYESALGFRVIFEERIQIGAQAMLSRVVQSASRAVTFTLIEPDPSAEAGQIDDFLKDHGGPGVQHVAFATGDIVSSVSALAARDVEFLSAPAAYYRLLADRLALARYSADDLAALSILVDADHDGQLFQIFARSVHPRRTFFFEVIERLGATTFGSGNIKALYEAVEAERAAT